VLDPLDQFVFGVAGLTRHGDETTDEVGFGIRLPRE
jgi:hypothetical protein